MPWLFHNPPANGNSLNCNSRSRFRAKMKLLDLPRLVAGEQGKPTPRRRGSARLHLDLSLLLRSRTTVAAVNLLVRTRLVCDIDLTISQSLLKEPGKFKGSCRICALAPTSNGNSQGAWAAATQLGWRVTRSRCFAANKHPCDGWPVMVTSARLMRPINIRALQSRRMK